VSDEFVRLGLEIGKPRRKVNGVELTVGEYDEFVKVAGQTAKQILDRIVAAPTYHVLPDDVQRELFEDVLKQARDSAKGLLFANENFLRRRVEAGLSLEEKKALDMMQGVQ